MTVNEIYIFIGQELYDAIPDDLPNWEKAIMYCKRLDRFFTGGGKLCIDDKEIKLDNFEARSEMADHVHELHAITTEGGHNRWNKLEFTLYPDFKFNLDFIWDQEWQDEVDGYNNEV